MLLALVAGASDARANGRFPHANQVAFGEGSRAVVRTTYGIVRAPRAMGTPWTWVCEGAIGYGGVYDPPMAVVGDELVLGLEDGVARSGDGCAWDRGVGAFGVTPVVDVTTDRATRGRVLALAATSPGSARSGAFESRDAGATWSLLGVLPPDVRWETLDTAPSRPRRVYASGVGPASRGTIARSDDGGATWRAFTFALGGGRAPYIGAVDPARPGRVYLRVDGEPADRVLMSDDDGATVREIFEGKAELLGLAVSPDGEQVAVGGPLDGVSVARAADLVFRKTSPIGVTCLAWTRDGLHACGLEPMGDFSLGVSRDDGRSFEPLYRARDSAPLACPAASPVARLCPAAWPALRASLGQLDEEPASGAPDVAAVAPRADTIGGAPPSLARRATLGAALLAVAGAGAWAMRRRARARG